ncbi:MAG: Coenzyme F420 hydrogenase/dehydrogenase, beta subunit C-terminal domain [Clostridia bacterium]|nr:Coenzyme F420 hydrogenase/dehydrogenase, beta subunit C-terminal domain [Clostridia bacterium]
MKIIASQNIDLNTKERCSSGGIFPLLAKHIIQKNGIVYGASFDHNFDVNHIAVDNINDLEKLYSSKYTLGKCSVFPEIKENLEKNIPVLFSGLPCQVFALKQYLKKDYDNLYIVDLICHGTPGANIWKDYRESVSKGRQIQNINFRDKGNGWSRYGIRIKFTNGSEYYKNHNFDPYMRALIDNLALSGGCYKCKNKGLENRLSDITLGDLWGAKSLAPELFDDMGTSLLFINTPKGEQLFSEISENVKSADIDGKKAVAINSSAVKTAKKNRYTDRFFTEYKSGKALLPLLKKYMYLNLFRKLVSKITKK